MLGDMGAGRLRGERRREDARGSERRRDEASGGEWRREEVGGYEGTTDFDAGTGASWLRATPCGVTVLHWSWLICCDQEPIEE